MSLKNILNVSEETKQQVKAKIIFFKSKIALLTQQKNQKQREVNKIKNEILEINKTINSMRNDILPITRKALLDENFKEALIEELKKEVEVVDGKIVDKIK